MCGNNKRGVTRILGQRSLGWIPFSMVINSLRNWFTPETSRETLTCMADDRDGLYDGGACQTQPKSRGDEARGNTLCTEEVAHENAGNRVGQPESGQVSRPEC